MKRRFRIALLWAVPVVIAALALGGWLREQALAAGRDLNAVRTDSVRIRTELAAGDLAGVRRLLNGDKALTSDAHRRVSGALWSAVSAVPFAGRGAQTLRVMAEAADSVTQRALPELVDAVEQLRRAQSAQSAAAVDLRVVAASEPALDAASRAFSAVTEELDGLPHATGISRVDAARSAFWRQAATLSAAVSQVDRFVHQLPSMLGGDGTRRYFLAIQTNAEARGTGGLVGAYGILAADRGVLRFERFGSDDEIPPADAPRDRTAGVPSPRPGSRPAVDRVREAVLLAESNLSPDFPTAAAAWTSQWRRTTGDRLDGAVATDPVGLADLLRVVGQVTLPDGERISARNALSVIEQEEYARFTDPVRRKRFLVSTAHSVAAALQSRPAPAQAILRALYAMVNGGRLRLWSSDPREQAALSKTALSGALAPEPGPFAELVVNNAAGTKLDYYLDRKVEYTLGPCRGGWRPSTVRIELRNGAPSAGLPEYVVARSDAGAAGRPAGSNKLRVSLYSTVGARLIGAALDGRVVLLSPGIEHRHPVFSTMVELAPGQSRVLRVRLDEPAGPAPVRIPVQPLARPQLSRLAEEGCG